MLSLCVKNLDEINFLDQKKETQNARKPKKHIL